MTLKVLLFGVDTCSHQYLIFDYVTPERGFRPFNPEPVHLTDSQTGFTIPPCACACACARARLRFWFAVA